MKEGHISWMIDIEYISMYSRKAGRIRFIRSSIAKSISQRI